MECPTNRWQSRHRRGLSFVEFVGCLVSMVGGVVLGSLYLGIEVKTMAAGMLEQAQVVAPGYFSRFATSPVEDADADESSTTHSDTLIAEGAEEVAAIGANASAVPGGDSSSQSGSTADSAIAAKQKPSYREQLEATRAYWDQLTAIMLAEAQGRFRGEGNPGEWELYDYLSQRKRGHEEALAKFEQLQSAGVDPRLADHGNQVIELHKAGIKLFEHGLSLLSDGPGAKLTGPFAQSWQSAATQFRMEESLVVDRHKAVAGYLDREYVETAPFIPAYEQGR